MLIDKKSHLFRLMNPLPLFCGFVARQLNFDVQVNVTKPHETGPKRSVPKVKLTCVDEGDKAKEDALKAKISESVGKYPRLEFKRGWVQIKKKKDKK